MSSILERPVRFGLGRRFSLAPTARAVFLIPVLAIVLSAQIALLAHSFSSESPSTMWLGAQLFALAAMGIVAWRVWLVATYRPVPGVSDAELPSITVIVPAYNEGRQVFRTISSLVHGDFPADRLHIVSVDDGSVDDTWQWIERAARAFPLQVVAVQCPENRGKRAALYEGFARARGDVIVTVDSDSEVRRDTLRNLVSPLVSDRRVGAVAGNVRVLNRDRGSMALPAMLDVAFTFAFEFGRASESRVDTVMCCPGALSAYRRSLVEAHKDEWLAQRFCGRPANIGEDRALTNLVLRGGHLVRFQSNAIVLTQVPTRYGQLAKMFLRWARSNVRETIALGRFVFTRFRRSPATGARVNFLWSASLLVLRPVGLVTLAAVPFVAPAAVPTVVGAILLSAALPASIHALARGRRGALWAFPYAVYSAVCLSWIGPYALVTPHRSKWLTRTLPAGPAAKAVPEIRSSCPPIRRRYATGAYPVR